MLAPVVSGPVHLPLGAVLRGQNPLAGHQVVPDARPLPIAERLHKIVFPDRLGQRTNPPITFEGEEIGKETLGADTRIRLIDLQAAGHTFEFVQRLLAGPERTFHLPGSDAGQQFHPLADCCELGERTQKQTLLRVLVPALDRIPRGNVDESVRRINIPHRIG